MNKLLEVLKDISALLVGAAALLYVLGYTVHLAYFRVLGVETIGQPLDYVRFAADYVASILASVPQLLLSAPNYCPKLFQQPFLIIAICCFGIIVLLCVLRVLSGPLKGLGAAVTTKKQLTFAALLNVVTIAGFLFVLRVEFDLAKVRDVLQTVDTFDVQQMQNQSTNPEVQKWDNKRMLDWKKENISRVYAKYVAAHSDTPGFHYWNDWFNPVASQNTSNKRSSTYLVLLLLNAVLLIAGIAQLIWLSQFLKAQSQPSSIKATRITRYWTFAMTLLFAFGIVVQLFMFPYVYATVGRYFSYPIVKLRLADDHKKVSSNTEEKVNTGTDNRGATETAEDGWTHGVYLIAQSDIEFIVYDRLNFFQVKHVPKARVLSMSQLFNASPFESCDSQEMVPCETLWISESTSTLDF